MIEVKGVKKEYSIPDREQGFKGMLSHIMNPKYKKIQAVNDISFNIAEGEIIGFLGPNGAGKSTTVKMLSGILYPSDGEINVWGVAPYRETGEKIQNVSELYLDKKHNCGGIFLLANPTNYYVLYTRSIKQFLEKILKCFQIYLEFKSLLQLQ